MHALHSCPHFVGLRVVIIERVVAALRICKIQENVDVLSGIRKLTIQMHIQGSIHTDSACYVAAFSLQRHRRHRIRLRSEACCRCAPSHDILAKLRVAWQVCSRALVTSQAMRLVCEVHYAGSQTPMEAMSAIAHQALEILDRDPGFNTSASTYAAVSGNSCAKSGPTLTAT